MFSNELCSPMRILLAEDDPCSQELMLRMLKNMGLHADVANNGLEVLRNLETRSYDVILMDIQMPKMDGLEFLDRIMRLRPMPVIMISAMTERG